ncbi:hypothetical protein OKW38_003400 [Paraburkholderia sp. MM5496-R1]
MDSERQSFRGRESALAAGASGRIDASLLRAILWISAAIGSGLRVGVKKI